MGSRLCSTAGLTRETSAGIALTIAKDSLEEAEEARVEPPEEPRAEPQTVTPPLDADPQIVDAVQKYAADADPAEWSASAADAASVAVDAAIGPLPADTGGDEPGMGTEWSLWGEPTGLAAGVSMPDPIVEPFAREASSTSEPPSQPELEQAVLSEPLEAAVAREPEPAPEPEPQSSPEPELAPVVEAAPIDDQPDVSEVLALETAANTSADTPITAGPDVTEPSAPSRQPESARDWLVERMEQAAAVHFGEQPPTIVTQVEVTEETAINPIVNLLPAAAAAWPPQAEPAALEVPPQQPITAEPPPEPAISGTFQYVPAEEPHSDSADAADDAVAQATPPPQMKPRARVRDMARRAVRVAGYAAACYLALVLVLIVVYRFVNPPASTLMLYEGLFGAGARQTWVPLDQISPHLVRAVLVAEDGRFCDHYGIDFAAIGEAIESADDGIPRGASTISMQVTKNLFLWQSKSYVRKLVELPLTLIMEFLWPKTRVLEVYLNIAEWGPGVFGAEAAAQHHFNRSAASLSEREAAQLAASLPNPIRRDAGDPGPRLQRKVAVIQNRVRSSGDVAFCIRQGRPGARSAALRGAGGSP